MSTTMGGQSNTGTNMGANAGQSQSQTRGEGQMMGRGGYEEGPVARTIEQQTKKLPSDTFLWSALGSIGASAVLRMMGKKHASLFVGQWVAPMLLLGVYNKIVKIQGSDRSDRGH